MLFTYAFGFAFGHKYQCQGFFFPACHFVYPFLFFFLLLSFLHFLMLQFFSQHCSPSSHLCFFYCGFPSSFVLRCHYAAAATASLEDNDSFVAALCEWIIAGWRFSHVGCGISWSDGMNEWASEWNEHIHTRSCTKPSETEPVINGFSKDFFQYVPLYSDPCFVFTFLFYSFRL